MENVGAVKELSHITVRNHHTHTHTHTARLHLLTLIPPSHMQEHIGSRVGRIEEEHEDMRRLVRRCSVILDAQETEDVGVSPKAPQPQQGPSFSWVLVVVCLLACLIGCIIGASITLHRLGPFGECLRGW